jgi:hypothetical protein
MIRTPIAGVQHWRTGPGFLYRAFVYPPTHICARSELNTRVVFFEGPYDRSKALRHLEQLLGLAWCMDTADWGQCYIENLSSERELLNEYGWAGPDAGDLNLFTTGCGGEVTPAVGPDRVHYAQREDIDLFVSPVVRARLDAAMTRIDALRASWGGTTVQLRRTGASSARQPEGVA